MEIYIHIPFCKSKCLYCDFNSIQCFNESLIKDYFNSLKKEIILSANYYKSDIISSIYIGGGTPSFVNENYIKDVIDLIYSLFNVDNNSENTIELNPESINENKLITYKKSKINRVSIGVQSLNNPILKQIGRIHTSEIALEKINLVKQYFNNVSCDLIIGLPNQTNDDITKELQILCPLLNHISVYELILEDNTPLKKLFLNNKINLPSEDETQDMFEYALNILYSYGFNRYEVSNFSKENKYISKHNMGYWIREQYLGFGAGAHSFIKENQEKRYSNMVNINDYINEINDSIDYKKIKRNTEILNNTDINNEIIMLGLRTNFGVKQELISNDIKNKYKKYFEQYNNRIKLNDSGLAVMNTILLDILNI